VIDFHTFSITARDRETGAFGVAAATARPNVGSLVPWVSPRGAIATQARSGRRAEARLGGRRRPHQADRKRTRPRGSPALWPGQVL